MNFEDSVGQAILDVLAKCGKADIEAGVGSLYTDEEKRLRDELGVTAIRTVSEWLAKYSARPPALRDQN